MNPQTHDGMPQFTLTRLANVKPDPAWSRGPPGQLSIHMTDQLLMGISFVKPARRLVLQCGELKRDYHVQAMVRVMEHDGMKVRMVHKKGSVTITVSGAPGSTKSPSSSCPQRVAGGGVKNDSVIHIKPRVAPPAKDLPLELPPPLNAAVTSIPENTTPSKSIGAAATHQEKIPIKGDVASPHEGLPADKWLRMTLLRAKFNYKYKRIKKPRLNAHDQAAYKHLLQGTPVC